jgi:arylsulfatase A-like enzyme
MRLPGQLAPARRAEPVMLVDVFPTIADLVGGVAMRDRVDGRPLFAANGSPTPVFAEHWWFEGGTYVSRMAQQGSHRLCETADETMGQERTEVYDLASDPGEQRNLLENSEALSDKTVGELRSLLARLGDKTFVASAASVDVDQSTKERLRQLGY